MNVFTDIGSHEHQKLTYMWAFLHTCNVKLCEAIAKFQPDGETLSLGPHCPVTGIEERISQAVRKNIPGCKKESKEFINIHVAMLYIVWQIMQWHCINRLFSWPEKY